MSADAVSYDEFSEVALSCLNQLCVAARRLTRNSADAEDVVQETYGLAFQHYRELRSLAHCRSWLHRILHRQVATRYRRACSGPQFVLIDGGTLDAIDEIPVAVAGEGDMLARLSLQEVRAAIDALPSDLRVAVTLCDIEGFTYAEIALITECPVGTVRSRIARARAKLIRKLRTHAEECCIGRRTS